MIPAWAAYFRNNAGRVPPWFLNYARTTLAQLVDAGGGTYAPRERINIAGAGLRLNPLVNATLFGLITRAAALRAPLRVERLALTTTDIEARKAGSYSDIINVDGSGQTGTRRIRLEVSAANKTGELCFVTWDPPSGSFNADVTSGSSNTQLITFHSAGAGMEWGAFLFDATQTGGSPGNPLGAWRLIGHGEA